MGLNLDPPRIGDKALDENKSHSFTGYFNERWKLWFVSLYNYILSFINPNGIFPPQFTVSERDALINPKDGSIIYVKDLPALQIRIAGAWKTFTVT